MDSEHRQNSDEYDEHLSSEKSIVDQNNSKSMHSDASPTLCFLLPSDLTMLTDYFILLFSQVTRGVMNEFDLDKAKHKSRKCDQLGFLGLRCRHCGGVERGSYFPSSAKNLQATPPTLHSHMIICEHVPDDVKRALKLTKSRHKFSAMIKPSGSQAVFFNNLWERIQSLTFTGADSAGLDMIATEIDFIIEQSKPKPMKVAVHQREPTTMTIPVNQAQIIELPNVVSYDFDNDYDYASQAIDMEMEISNSPPTEEDFELALELLRQPDSTIDFHHEHYMRSPDMAFAVTPTDVSGLLSPIPTRVNSFGERYHNGKFVISSNYEATNFCEETSPIINDDDGRTRKFSRSDEVQLVRGILKYGKSSWKKIWEETRELQHIKHSALKDRARSKRFCSILERAKHDPSLLDRPEELCGDEHSPAYHTPMASTPRAWNGGATPVDEPFSEYGPLQRR